MVTGHLTSSLRLLITTFTLLIATAAAQNIFDCPDLWENFGHYCYKFVGDLPLKYDDAAGACGADGAGLHYVETVEEHGFIRNRLEKGDPFQRKWLTSGHGGSGDTAVGDGETSFQWKATSEQVKEQLQFWLPGEPDPEVDESTAVIAYMVGETGYGWGLLSEGDASAFICKIDRADAFRIVQTTRGFDYGLDVREASVLERGPHFLLMPHSIVVVSGSGQQAVLECLVAAVPEATYRWLRGLRDAEEMTSSTDERYTFTNGRLSIQSPDEGLDAGHYTCEASNKFGTVISRSITVTFGYLAEFNNVPNAPARANAYDGVAIQCSQINYKPAIRYQWLKDQSQFIRTDMQAYIFISNNGKLYFSEVTRSDEGDYRCIAMLTGVNQYTIGTSQPPTRISLPIPLLIQDQSPKSDWGPEIHNDFPAVFPQPPLRGQDVRLECFAYGSSTTPFYYSWQREGKPMPQTAVTEDHHRVLLLPNAQLEDSGTYTCSVRRSSNARDSRSYHLSLGARPYFVAPLKDQHADVGSQLTWRCEARGNPDPIHSWYKNGQYLSSDPASRVLVAGNVLTIIDLEAEMHDGMYQCGAINSHGAEMSNAQLRVLSFAPTFAKLPLPSQSTGSIGGELTLVCNPEAAPFPLITWHKDGAALAPDGNHLTQLTNGNLRVRDLSRSDTGRYTCRAENKFGEASSSTRLALATGASISSGPTPTSATVNTTVFLPCRASSTPVVDTAFVWHFNDHLIDTSLPQYTQMDSNPTGQSGLYVKNVQFEHEGFYRCTLRTPFTEDYKQAYLTVRGPPGVVGGVLVDTRAVSRQAVGILWTPGTDHGSSVFSYRVEAEDAFSPGVWTTVTNLRAQDTVQADATSHTGKRRAAIEGLNPGTGYRFRVIAQNEFGPGPPSSPSAYVKTVDAPPAVSPRHVRGGGGSVGVLTLRWQLLDRAEWGSTDVAYRVFWRPKEHGLEQGLWDWEVKRGHEDQHVVLVGDESYYMLYQVKVQAFNIQGQGPNSSVYDVYSAEGIPSAPPTNVQSSTVNSTALEVTWDPVSDTRAIVKGAVLGYQINYWPEFMLASDYHRFIRHYGQLATGLVIGLEVDVNTWVDVQVYNTAGLGPRSESYIMETSGPAPLTYPAEVRVYSAGPNSARVWFRGITVLAVEEGLFGYVIYYWNANEDARSALMVELPLQTTEWVLTGLDETVLYAIRIAGFSSGGTGRKSPTQYFTYAGSVYITYAFSQTIDVFMAPAATPQPSTLLLALLLLLLSALPPWLSWQLIDSPRCIGSQT